MEEYLEELQEEENHALINKSVSAVLRDQFLNCEEPQLTRAEFEFIMSYRWGQDYGCDADNMTAQYQEMDLLFDESEDLVQGQMGQIVDIMSKNLKIQKQWPVSQIKQVNNQVILRNMNNQSMIFDKIVLSVPLGVLKAETLNFEPQLPYQIRSAYQRLGSGMLDKLVL